MAWLSGWSKRIKLTVDADLIDAALSNFPVPVYISAASGIGDVDASCVFDELTSDANRKKIAVTTSDGETQCYVEIERWDDANEKAWLHIKLPAVSESADTDLYLYYDSAHADNTTYVGDTTDAAAQSVWDSNFLAVWHMGQDPNGDAANAVKNSKSDDQHLTPAGSMTSADLVDGKFGKGIDFDGTNDTLSNTSTSRSGGAFTVNILIKPTTLSNYNCGIGAKNAWGAFVMHSAAAGGLYAGTDVTTRFDPTATGSSVYQNGVWSNVAYTYSGTQGSIYKNGALLCGPKNQNSPGAWGGFEMTTISGVVDEVRISNIARSAAWLKATYNGLSDSLLTFGTEEEILAPKEAYHAHYAEEPALTEEWLHPKSTILTQYADKPLLNPLWMRPKDSAHSFYANKPILAIGVITALSSAILHYTDQPTLREEPTPASTWHDFRAEKPAVSGEITSTSTWHDFRAEKPAVREEIISASSYLSLFSEYPHLTQEFHPSGSIMLQPVDRPKLSSTAWARVSPPNASWTISQPTTTTWTKQ